MFRKEKAEEMYDGDVQQCPSCKGWHSAHSPRLCHGCATGRAQSGLSKGYHPEA